MVSKLVARLAQLHQMEAMLLDLLLAPGMAAAVHSMPDLACPLLPKATSGAALQHKVRPMPAPCHANRTRDVEKET